jgi:hypothetical protein
MRQANRVGYFLQGEGGAVEVPPFAGAVKAGGIEHGMRVDMRLVDMHRNHEKAMQNDVGKHCWNCGYCCHGY